MPAHRTLARLAAALTIALGAAAPAALAQPAPPADATLSADGTSPRLDAARERRAAAQAAVDAASADLARIRGEMFTAADPAERAALEAEERGAQARKDALVRVLEQRDRQLADITADLAREERAQREADTAAAGGAVPAGDTDSPTGIVLAPAARMQPATAPVTVPAAGGGVVVLSGPASAPDAARIDAYLASKLSPMTGLGAVFVAEAGRVGLDPRFLVAVSGAETSFGAYGPSQAIHNPFGLGPGMSFHSWPDAIRTAADTIGGRLYRGDGRVTIPAINQRWAPIGAANDPTNLNSNWTRNVSTYYAELGGDPSAPVFTGVTAAVPAGAPLPFAPVAGLATAPVDTGPSAAERALTLLGSPHAAAGEGDGVDAGGLVQTVYAAQGVPLPATPAELAGAGTPVEPADLRAGDAVLFSDPDGTVSHVGLYLGAGQFVHAPGPGDVVSLASLYDEVWATSYSGARRY